MTQRELRDGLSAQLFQELTFDTLPSQTKVQKKYKVLNLNQFYLHREK